ncbi:MAG: hypothetical protein FJX77_00035 [Armatimonadetes bacterium]|nr:hypothetical protein [Armatimonadota bacterium]
MVFSAPDCPPGTAAQYQERLGDLERALAELRRLREGLYAAEEYRDYQTLVGREAEVLAEHGYVWVPGVEAVAPRDVQPEPDPEAGWFERWYQDRWAVGWACSWLVIMASIGVALAHWLSP